MLKNISFTSLVAIGSLVSGPVALGQNSDPLLFPKDKFTTETKTVRTSAGEKKVTYKSFLHIPYVANPVDENYQSLNVSVPVSIDGVAIDATNAPILLTIGVGGYMSFSNMRTSAGGPGNPGGFSGGMGGPPPGAGPGSGPGGPGGPGGSDSGNGTPGGPGSSAGGPGRPGNGPGGPEASRSKTSGNADLALAAGYVIVSPGVRGRDNKAADGTYYGKAPAAIVDLKAAVRYIRHNKGILPGNSGQIFSTGVSAGGALSALLASSGNSPLYEPYLKEIGAAPESDGIFGCAAFCPITDLDHADGAYEWMYGNAPLQSGLVDQPISQQLKALNAQYQLSLHLQGRDGFGTITADNYDQYLLKYELFPAAERYLSGLDEDRRKAYLDKNSWLKWDGSKASFSFKDYVAHVGRMKSQPAFDDFEAKNAEPVEFGDRTTNARHFTDFSQQHATGDKNAVVSPELKKLVNCMNAMYFIGEKNKGCAQYWWLRQGSSDAHTSQTVLANLAVSLENQGKDVNTSLYWDAGHGADEDPEAFIAWIARITGYKVPKS